MEIIKDAAPIIVVSALMFFSFIIGLAAGAL